MYFRFLTSNFLRGSFKDRMAGYHMGILDGIMTRNEARGLEEWAPVEGGDEIFVPVNTMPLSKALAGDPEV